MALRRANGKASDRGGCRCPPATAAGAAGGSGSFPRRRRLVPGPVRSLLRACGSRHRGAAAQTLGCPRAQPGGKCGRSGPAGGAGGRWQPRAVAGRLCAGSVEHAGWPTRCPEALGRGAESRIQKASLRGSGSQWDGPGQRGWAAGRLHAEGPAATRGRPFRAAGFLGEPLRQPRGTGAGAGAVGAAIPGYAELGVPAATALWEPGLGAWSRGRDAQPPRGWSSDLRRPPGRPPAEAGGMGEKGFAPTQRAGSEGETVSEGGLKAGSPGPDGVGGAPRQRVFGENGCE